MDDRPLKGLPVREGVAIVNGSELVVWQEHLWNTGDRTRVWLVRPEEICVVNIIERDIDLDRSGPA